MSTLGSSSPARRKRVDSPDRLPRRTAAPTEGLPLEVVGDDPPVRGLQGC